MKPVSRVHLFRLITLAFRIFHSARSRHGGGPEADRARVAARTSRRHEHFGKTHKPGVKSQRRGVELRGRNGTWKDGYCRSVEALHARWQAQTARVNNRAQDGIQDGSLPHNQTGVLPEFTNAVQ